MVDQAADKTIRWILDHADTGFFIVTAPANMQSKLAGLYKTSATDIYNYADDPAPFSYAGLMKWAKPRQDKGVFFLLNMQLALANEKDMLSFNMCRDMLAKEHKVWVFFMTKDLDNRLAAFAYDIYSYVQIKAHFMAEEEDSPALQRSERFDIPVNIIESRESLRRNKDLEESLMALPLNNTPDNQLLSAAISLSNIAGYYRDSADYANALRLLNRIKDIREKVLGQEHPDTATTYSNIANVYFRQGEYAKALEWNEKALAIREKMLGQEHPDTATAYNNIAVVYRSQGEYAKALEWHEKALAIRENVLGKEHPDTDQTYNNIAYVYESLGEYAKAMEWNEKALAIKEKVLGKEHPDIANIYNNIAVVYSAQGEYAKALDWFEKALAIREKVLGKEHPDTANTYWCIAVVFENKSYYAEALKFYVRSYEVFLRKLGITHPHTKECKNGMKRTYNKAGLPEPFEQWLEERLG